MANKEKKKVKLWLYNASTIAVIIGAAVLILVFSLMPHKKLIAFTDLFSIIGVVVSSLLAFLAYILTIKIQKTDETVEVLIEQNNIMKDNINEQKKINLHRYRALFNDIDTTIKDISKKITPINSRLLELKNFELIADVNFIYKTLDKLSLTPLYNYTLDFQNAIAKFHLCLDVFNSKVDNCSNKEIFDEFWILKSCYGKLYDVSFINEDAYKKTFL